jgi:predicted CXXCH cytochrome family protein
VEKHALYRYDLNGASKPALRRLRLVLPPSLIGGFCLLVAAMAWSVKASDGSSAGLRMTASIDPNKCAGCHQFDPHLSHPVNITPSMAIPAGFPLTEGRITCQTCHTEGGIEAHAEAQRNHTGMLRMEAELLCSQCHSGAELTAKSMHPTSLGRAHLQAPVRTATVTDTPGTLDAESRNCLSCHDGSVASDIVGGMSQGIAVQSGNHPIGIKHANTLRGSGSFKYQSDMPVVPASSLPLRFRLFDGNIGCGSCHSPYTIEKKYLVASNHGSRLCLTCHGG